MHRRLAAAVTLSVALLLGACNDDAPKPPPPQSPAPTMPSESPTSPTPTSSPSASVDQEAADKAAAEQAYRTQFAELNRLEMAGGTTKPTERLRDSASGKNLEHLMQWLREDKRTGQRQLNPAKLLSVVAHSGTSSRRAVTACEDYSAVKWVRHGKPYKPNGASRIVQHAIAKKGQDGKWRIDLVSSTAVKRFSEATCGQE